MIMYIRKDTPNFRKGDGYPGLKGLSVSTSAWCTAHMQLGMGIVGRVCSVAAPVVRLVLLYYECILDVVPYIVSPP